MPLTRHFLGWDRPCLASAADYLLARFAASQRLDLRNVTVVLPGARALHRLNVLLLERAEQAGLRYTPPQLRTVGQIADLLCDPPESVADDLWRYATWGQALAALDPEALAMILPHPPRRDDHPAWLSWGEVFDRLHTELAAGGLEFTDAQRATAEMDRPAESRWWQVAAQVRSDYLQRLNALGIRDPQQRVFDALHHRRCRAAGPIVLIASDLSAAQCRMISQVAGQVTALIFAPQALADRFDEFGVVCPQAWREAPVDVLDEQLQFVDHPAGQAAAVIETVASYGGRYAADEISIGLADASLGPYVQQQLTEWELPWRDTAGVPLSRTAPPRLLAAAADLLEHDRFMDLAVLVRHPDVQRCLVDRLGDDVARGATDWLRLMDEYYSDHLQGRLAGTWLGRSPRRERLKQVHDAIEALLRPLRGDRRPLNQWAGPISGFLTAIYGTRDLDGRDESQRVLAEACARLARALTMMHALPAALVAPMTAAAAIRILLRLGNSASVPPAPAIQPAVELLGWLELSLDDAPALIVTGFNEGSVPTSISADPFLPDVLRQRLGLTDNDRRYARDAYLLSAILASRPDVKLLGGRWSAEGESLAPSRLALACAVPRIARRIRTFYESESPLRTVASRLQPAAMARFQVPPSLPQPLRPVMQIAVTAFRDYLACPYRFYLRHVLRLRQMDDTAQELDGGAFGNLAHDVLRDFGRSDAAGSTDPAVVGRALSELLNHRVRDDFGSDPPPAVRVQVEQLRARLETFASHQTQRRGEGWLIHHTELDFTKSPVLFDVDGQPIELIGRIDRIDVHEKSGEYAVFDYKTGDQARDPEDVHRSGEEWVDLQLPLYCRLVRAIAPQAVIQTGYILLPRSPGECGFVPANWSAELVAEAEECARRVVRAIRGGAFEPAARPPDFDDFADICGVGNLASALGGDDE